ncbi:MAG: kinase-like domain-containing protein [Monoraphidium minutum]|nr:MAG: kinase-like domain-containing protein [Monoraphidium minutum]
MSEQFTIPGSLPSGAALAPCDWSSGLSSTSCGSAAPNTVSSCPPSAAGLLKAQQAPPRPVGGPLPAVLAGLSFSSAMPEVVLERRLDGGGSRGVYSGFWLTKTPAAIKVMHTHDNEHEAIAHAFEMAVLSSVQHPNIVQAYATLTDMVDVDAAATDAELAADDDANSVRSVASASAPRGAVFGRRFRRLAAGEAVAPGCLADILVMEVCDMGRLADVLDRGDLRGPVARAGGAAAADAAAAGAVLLDVACGLKYLHSMRLVHGDVRPENVLLRSEPLRPLGAVAKLGGFGGVAILDEAGAALGLRAAPPAAPGGAAPPAAPGGAGAAGVELVRGPPQACAGRMTLASDVHAFGTLIWEVFTRGARPAAAGVPRGGAGAAPPGPYAGLAAKCWAADPAARPTMDELAEAIEQLATADMELRGFGA